MSINEFLVVPVMTERRVMKPSAHSGVRVSSTLPTSLYLGDQADDEDRTDSMFDIASENLKKPTTKNMKIGRVS